MSYIIRRRVKSSIYVYECISYRNKDGKPRSRQKYLGKLDSDGILITKKRKLPAQIREVKKVTRKFILEPVPKVQESPADFVPDITSKKETPISANSGSTGRLITDANTLALLIPPFRASTHVRGMNTMHALSVIDRKPKSLIA